MGIVEVSKKRGYKIAMWVLLGFGSVFFLMGGIFMLAGIGSASASPQEIKIVAAGKAKIVEGETWGNRKEYYLDVFEKETSIWINTSPWGSADRVSFDIRDGDSHLEIKDKKGVSIERAWPGEEVVLTLISNPATVFGFNEKVEIDISSGQQRATLTVTIVLPSDAVKLDFEIKNDYFGFGNTIRADLYRNEVYSPDPDKPKNESQFKFIPKFTVFGVSVPAESVEFDESQQDFADDSGIRLFGTSSGFRGVYIPYFVLLSMEYETNVKTTFGFKITATFLGKEYVDFFELRIVK